MQAPMHGFNPNTPSVSHSSDLSSPVITNQEVLNGQVTQKQTSANQKTGVLVGKKIYKTNDNVALWIRRIACAIIVAMGILFISLATTSTIPVGAVYIAIGICVYAFLAKAHQQRKLNAIEHMTQVLKNEDDEYRASNRFLQVQYTRTTEGVKILLSEDTIKNAITSNNRMFVAINNEVAPKYPFSFYVCLNNDRNQDYLDVYVLDSKFKKERFFIELNEEKQKFENLPYII